MMTFPPMTAEDPLDRPPHTPTKPLERFGTGSMMPDRVLIAEAMKHLLVRGDNLLERLGFPRTDVRLDQVIVVANLLRNVRIGRDVCLARRIVEL